MPSINKQRRPVAKVKVKVRAKAKAVRRATHLLPPRRAAGYAVSQQPSIFIMEPSLGKDQLVLFVHSFSDSFIHSFSCKAFFRRAIQNEVWSEFICRANNDCEIGLQSRKHCQKCRYDRCIKVGMKPGWVLSKVERQRRFNKRHVSSSDPVAGSPGPSSATSTSSSPSSYFKHQLSLSDPPEVMELVQVKEEAVSSPEESQSDYKDDQTLPENAPSTDSGESVEAEGDDDDEVNDSAESVCSDLVLRSCGQDSVVQFFSSVYDTNYTSVNFGESLLKEMMMCSLFGVPISTSAAMSAYR